MDPITAAIVAALTAGAISGFTETGKTGVIDTYQALKDLLVKKFGARSQLVQAVDHLEAKPTSQACQGRLTEEIMAVQAEQDTDMLAVAKHLLTLVQPQQRGLGKFTVQNNAVVQGQSIGDHHTITQQFGERPNV